MTTKPDSYCEDSKVCNAVCCMQDTSAFIGTCSIGFDFSGYTPHGRNAHMSSLSLRTCII